jgi:hypothetical protein
MNSRVEIGVILGPSNERNYGAVRCFSFTHRMVVTRQHKEIFYNFPSNFPWKKDAGNLFASDFFLLKKETCRTDTSIFPDIPDPLGRFENIQLLTSEEHMNEEIQVTNSTEHTA